MSSFCRERSANVFPTTSPLAIIAVHEKIYHMFNSTMLYSLITVDLVLFKLLEFEILGFMSPICLPSPRL